jgi:hypothetical protein
MLTYADVCCTYIYRRGMTFTSLDYTWYEWARAEVLTLLALLVQKYKY